ncbi:Replication-associated protein G2P [Salmonella enterica]|uniref:Replication-associated protein G2P n=2 Tax=Salmonella enterica TaxID=28901 RepID=A0A5Y6EML3_SALER|nr:phage/plasmid replication protein [Salmonella enterica]EAA7364338.1 Replication-associated protein G2P [Salmonella enterica subsp. enterica]ECM5338278.1 Replication-associated protein G2P [Salmonella enterica subsp. enterica serovar Give]EDB9083014.1 Replication-associated protein G2P [Salmonella enterica subsp. enterica serovar Newport]EAO5073292.1 Replication-associated protein G2P [Salmonella enterica]EAQ7627415.1 Replication-associated protein G2P [Salmonella enterica]
MFFDWLTIEQDFGYQLPILSDVAYQRVHLESGEASALSQPTFQHKGSFCDVISISIRGSLLKVSGNPSRWGRLDNLFGLKSVDACVSVYNEILSSLGLPVFTKCTRLMPRQGKENEAVSLVADGACIRELHITSNRSVGKGNEDAYISGLSTLPYRNSVPRLHSNGKSVDWLSKKGNASLIYPTVYNKAHELVLHSLQKIKSKFGDNSKEYNYLIKIIEYCSDNGIVRFEQKLKSRFLQKHHYLYWGLSDYSSLSKLHNQFVNLDKTLSVTAMDFDTISEHLISQGVVDSTRSANTTAMYAIQWMHGHSFDFNKKQVQTHRARLRKIGIDIAQRCNIAKFSPVIVRNKRDVVVSDCKIPDWYHKASHLKVA